MKAVVFDKIRHLQYQQFPDSKPATDEVLIRVIASGICATDLHIYEGSFIATYPIIPGHEFSGEVMAVGNSCQRIKVGDRVAVGPNIPCNNCTFCLTDRQHFCKHMLIPGVNIAGGMAQLVCVKERGVFNIGNLSYEEGAMMEPLSCVLHGVDRLFPAASQTALVLGAGSIGLLLGRTLRARGIANLDYLEKNRTRMDKVASECRQVFEELEDIPAASYHCVIDATGVADLVSRTISKLQPSGKMLIFGVPSPEAQFKLPAFFIMKNENQVIGSLQHVKTPYGH